MLPNGNIKGRESRAGPIQTRDSTASTMRGRAQGAGGRSVAGSLSCCHLATSDPPAGTKGTHRPARIGLSNPVCVASLCMVLAVLSPMKAGIASRAPVEVGFGAGVPQTSGSRTTHPAAGPVGLLATPAPSGEHFSPFEQSYQSGHIYIYLSIGVPPSQI